MSMGIFNIAVTGMNAARAGLATTEHNIANVNTPGYHRQEVLQRAVAPNYSGAGFFGRGVEIETVRRIYDQFLDEQVALGQAQVSRYQAYQNYVTQLDSVLGQESLGVSTALSGFFAALNDVAADADDVTRRSVMLSRAQTLVDRFRTLDGLADDLRSQVNGQIKDTVLLVNQYAKEIAGLNEKISWLQGATGDVPNDLIDRRDELVRRLNEQVQTDVVRQGSSYNIFISGQTLVLGERASTLSAVPSPEDPQRLQLAVGLTVIPEQQLIGRGGALGGLFAFRDEVLDSVQNQLGRLAVGVAQQFNDQHRLGQDLSGALGGLFFAAPVLKAPIPSAATVSANPGLSLGIGLADPARLTGSDYRLSYDGTNFSVVRLSDKATVYSGAAFPAGPIDGFTLSVTGGAFAGGESFLIQPTREAAGDIRLAISDPSKIAAAAPIRTVTAAANTGTGSISAGTVNPPPPPNPNLQNTVTLTFTSPTTFDVYDAALGVSLASGVAYTPGADISYNGWTVQISGAPAAGDVFTVEANAGGVTDGRNAILLAGLETSKTLAADASGAPTASYAGAYNMVLSQVANKTFEVKANASANSALLDQVRAKREELSGVNLDEEAANLIRYQQSYAASAKAFQVAVTVFDTLLDAMR